MPSNMLIKSALFGLVLLPFLSLAAEKATPAVPATPAMPATPAVPAEKETIFGSQLMTAEERTASAHKCKMPPPKRIVRKSVLNTAL